MRNEFYGDPKDLWKWSVVLNEADRGKDRHVLYVAMRRPDHALECNPKIRPDVIDFFRGEGVLRPGKEVSRIGMLSPRIQLVVDDYEPARRDVYFASITHVLESRPRGRSYVLFLDPDTGVSEKHGPKHVSTDQLTLLWRSMQIGDTLVIYQHHAREEKSTWLIKKRGLIARALQTKPSGVAVEECPGVCFFLIDKKAH